MGAITVGFAFAAGNSGNLLDPSIDGTESDKVNLPDTAYAFANFGIACPDSAGAKKFFYRLGKQKQRSASKIEKHKKE